MVSIYRLDPLRKSNRKRILDGCVSPMERYELLPIIERLERIEEKIDKIYIDNWMSTKAVSICASLSPKTLDQAVHRGDLRVSQKIGKNLYKREWIDRWLTN